MGRPTRELSTEVLVCGGGYAGIAAALAAARTGKRVLLLERRTYLGAETTATLRPWAAVEGLEGLFGRPEGDWALVPDQLKTALEDLLLDAGVTLLYAVWPAAVRLGAGVQVEAYGKAGRLLIDAATLVDATEQAVLARLVCPAAARPAQEGATLWRTIELTGVDVEAVGDLAIPSGLAPAWRCHPGYDKEHGHLLLEYGVHVVPGADPTWRVGAELQARRAGVELARWLKQNHSAFAQLKLASSSHDLAAPPLWRVTPDETGPIFVASACAVADDAAAAAMALSPAALARAGAGVGVRAAAATHAARPAESVHVALPVVRLKADVLVVGGGTSGAPAAIGAARRGSTAVLADMNPALGGTGTLGGVDSYWFGRRGGFNAEVARWVAEQQRWMELQGNKWNIEAKMLAWQTGVEQARVTPLLSTVFADVRTDGAGTVTGALLVTPECLVEVSAMATVDATGDGDVAVAAGAPHVYGSEREGVTMWYSLSPQIRPGVSKNNFTSMVDVGDPFDYTRAILSGRRRLPGHDHGPYIAPRESRHVLGDVRLTMTDILTMRQWPDTINIHFSNHDVKGQNTSDWLRMGLIPPNFEVELPYRAVVPQAVDGLLVTGKAISATHDALPPVRMQADLENLGYACGVAAALSAQRQTAPRHLPVADLQAALVAEGLLPDGIAHRALSAETKPTPAEMQQWIDALDDADKLYLYGEVEMDEIRRAPIPMVQVCTAGPEIVPLLRRALEDPGHRGRLQVARGLAWNGDASATPVLLAAIEPHLVGDELPPRAVHIRYTQASPDHGAMPELAYLLHTLAMAKDPAAIPLLMRLAERVKPTDAKIRDQMSGTFHYVDAICDIAERLGHPECLPALHRLRDEPLLRSKTCTDPVQPDFFQERLAYLELTIARAMAACGDQAGVQVLEQYLGDVRRPLARFARQTLGM